jgi:hypothetical protein
MKAQWEGHRSLLILRTVAMTATVHKVEGEGNFDIVVETQRGVHTKMINASDVETAKLEAVLLMRSVMASAAEELP